MTPTDPKQDVRQQFETCYAADLMTAYCKGVSDGKEAALQSPAVRELVEALQGVIAVADRKTDEFDRAKAALRTLGAGHVE